MTLIKKADLAICKPAIAADQTPMTCNPALVAEDEFINYHEAVDGGRDEDWNACWR
jgi:hypothetical protein